MSKDVNKFIMVAVLLVILIAARTWAILQTRGNGAHTEDGREAGPALAKVRIEGTLSLDVAGAGRQTKPVLAALLADTTAARETLSTLARHQVFATYLQTIFRDPALPLPADLMELSLGERRYDEKRHRLVVPYSLEGYIVAPAASLTDSVPELAEVGAEYTETFIVSADPRHLFQRLGYACANQDEIPLGLVDDANYGNYFDPTCAPGVELCVHPEKQPLEPCMDVLARENGAAALTVHLTREPYDLETAARWTSPGAVTAGGADLAVDGQKLADHDIIWKKFPADSCAITEGCVGAPGWRRLLRFRAVTPNVGDADLAFGDVKELLDTNQFVWSECHGHYHFNGYGRFGLEKDGKEVVPGTKLSFCVESTGRARNAADVAMTAPYQECENQGIVAGWEDEYFAGLDCQWLDITDLPIEGQREKFTLSMEVNPQRLLCEGLASPDEYEPALDDNGGPILGPNGEPAQKQVCDMPEGDRYANNVASVDVEVPARGAAVNEPCATLDFGPLRNCGWTMRTERACQPGERIKTYISEGAEVVRACPGSYPCTHNDGLVSADTNAVSFTCPEEGRYLLMSAPYLADAGLK